MKKTFLAPIDRWRYMVKAFLSHTDEIDSATMQRITRLGNDLRARGIDVYADFLYVSGGQSFQLFMDNIVKDETLDYILMACSTKYNRRYDRESKKTGVGYEANLIQQYWMNNEKRFEKVIPLLFQGNKMPKSLEDRNKKYIEMRDDAEYEENYMKLYNILESGYEINSIPLNARVDASYERIHFKESVSELLKKARNGDGDAQLQIALRYERGIDGLSKSKYAMHNWLEQAVNNNNSAAMVKLSTLYEHGDTVEMDLKIAHQLLNKAAEMGNSSAQLSLGVINNYGYSVERETSRPDCIDKTISMEWYQKAAKNGNARAYNNIGRAHIEKAEECFRISADMGDPQGMYNLAWLCKEFGKIDEATEWYSRAAILWNMPEAMNNLAEIYEKGEDFERALKWYDMAANMGHEKANRKYFELNNKVFTPSQR